MFNVGNLFANLSLVTTQFSKGLNAAVAEARAAGSAIGSALGSSFDGVNQAAKDLTVATRGAGDGFKDVSRIVQGIMISQVFYAGVSAIKDATSAVASYNNELEQTNLAFKYLLGSSDQAHQFVGALQDFAATTPFTTQSAADAARMMLAMGFAANQVLPTLRILTDASAVTGGDEDKFRRIVYALGEMKTMGTVQTRQLMQLAQAGIPVYDILEKKLGMTAEQLHKIGKAGIDSNVAIQAILQGLQEKYAGASQEMAKTTRGLLSTLKDDFLIVGNLLTQGISDSFKGVLSNLVDFTEKLRSIGTKEGLGGLMNALFPPEMQTQIRAFTQYVGLLIESFGKLLAALWPIGREFINAFVISFNLIAPVVIFFINLISKVISVLTSATPVVRAFVFTIMAMQVASWVSTSVLMLVRAVQGLAVSGPIAKLVSLLAAAIKGLTLAMIENPMLALFAVLAGGLLALALSFQETTQWIDRFTASLGRLFGFNVNEMWKPLDPSSVNSDLGQFYDGLNNANDAIGGGLDKTKDKAKDTAKAMKDLFVASFDEVHQIPDNKDKGSGGDPGSGGGDGSGGGSPSISAPTLPTLPQEGKNDVLPPLKWPAIPPFPPWPPIPPLPPLPNFPPFPVIPPYPAFPPIPALPPLPPWPAFPPWPAIPPIPILDAIPDMSPVWQKIRDGAGSIGNDVIGSISGAFGRVGSICVDFGNNLSAGLAGAGAAGLAAISPSLVAIQNAFTAFGNASVSIFTTAFTTCATVTSTILTGIGNDIATFTTTATATITGWFNTITQGVSTFGANVMSSLRSTWQNVLANTSSAWQSITVSVSTSWSSMISSCQSAGGSVMSIISSTWSNVLSSTTAVWNNIVSFFSGAWQRISGIATQMSASIPAPIKSMWTTITGLFTDNSGLIGTIFATCVAGLLLAAGNLKTNFGGIFEGIVAVVEGAFVGIRGIIGGAMSAVVRGFNTLIDSLNNFHIDIPSWVPDLGGKSFGFSLSHWAVPAFETGGIVGRDQIVRVGEKNKREAIIPLENSTAMAPFADAVAARISAQAQAPTGTSGSDNRPIMYVGTLIADDRSLKQLERKLEVVRIQEAQRKGGR